MKEIVPLRAWHIMALIASLDFIGYSASSFWSKDWGYCIVNGIIGLLILSVVYWQVSKDKQILELGTQLNGGKNHWLIRWRD